MSQFNYTHTPTPITRMFIYELRINLRIKAFDEMTLSNSTKGQVIKSLYDVLFKDLFIGFNVEYNNNLNWNIADGLSNQLQQKLEED